jgi:thiosulfate dehydrogenase
MHKQRETTRVSTPRVRLTMIALAMACGRGDAPAAAEPASVTPPPAARAAPDTSIPAGAVGDAIRRGHALLANTRDSLPSHVGSSLRCFSCHLDEGRRANALPLIGSYTRYPQFRARRARVDLIEDRVNDCFERSLNGRAIAVGGGDMRDIVTYLAWMSRGVAVGDSAKSQGTSQFATLESDTARGAKIFSENCARCHGAAGQGTVVAPPLWGPKSFNIGAGMARYRTAALFVLHNMPFDKPNSLSPQQALDVARYIDSRPRPDFAGKDKDWPAGGRPSDVPYRSSTGAPSGADTARASAHNGAH